MQPGTVTHACFDGVAKGVAKIQDCPETGFALIRPNHLRLDLAAAADRMRQCGPVPRHQGINVRFEPIEKRHISNRAVLDHLGQPCAELPRRQGAQNIEVAHHQLRLVEGTDHVLAQRMIDGRLAPHRRIDLREQGRGHLHKGHAPHVASRGKTRHVTHHSSAERKQYGFAVATVREECVEDQLERLPVFVLFAVGQQDFMDLPIAPLQRRPKLGGVKRTDGRIGDNQGSTCRGRSCVRRRHGDESCANGNVVATVAEFDGDFLGRLEHRLEWLD